MGCNASAPEAPPGARQPKQQTSKASPAHATRASPNANSQQQQLQPPRQQQLQQTNPMGQNPYIMSSEEQDKPTATTHDSNYSYAPQTTSLDTKYDRPIEEDNLSPPQSQYDASRYYGSYQNIQKRDVNLPPDALLAASSFLENKVLDTIDEDAVSEAAHVEAAEDHLYGYSHFSKQAATHTSLAMAKRIRKDSTLVDRPESIETPSGAESWNANYQRALDLPESSPQEVQDKYQRLTKLATDFVKIATQYGRVIITELSSNRDQKTIGRSRIGGVAGGAKYIVSGILFKLAQDPKLRSSANGDFYLYGGENHPSPEFACKAASHELKGAIHYNSAMMDIDHRDGETLDVRVPMQALVDYRGYRLIVRPLIPLGEKSIIYGSNDAGRSIHNSDKRFHETMRRAAEIMHLRGHQVGQSSASQYLYCAGDVEGHVGNDGRHYLLDFGRTFPPESCDPQQVKHLTHFKQGVFFRMLRPEFLRHIKGNEILPALNPDSLSNWGKHDKDFDVHNQEIQKATTLLFKIIVPNFANWLELKLKSMAGEKVRAFPLTFEMHQRGINMRHLGLIRSRLPQGSKASSLVLVEAVKRTLKNILRAWLRSETSRRPSDFMINQIVIGFCNLVSGYHFNSRKFWSSVCNGVILRFGKCTFYNTEADENYDLLSHVSHSLNDMIDYCLQMVGLDLTDSCRAESQHHALGFRFTTADIRDGDVRVKHMSFIDLIRGKFLANQGFAIRKIEPNVGARLLRLSAARFHAALMREPSNIELRKDQTTSLAAAAQIEKHWLEADTHIINFITELPETKKNFRVVEEILSFLFILWAERRALSLSNVFTHYCGGAANQQVLLEVQRLVTAIQDTVKSDFPFREELELIWRFRQALSIVFWEHLKNAAPDLVSKFGPSSRFFEDGIADQFIRGDGSLSMAVQINDSNIDAQALREVYLSSAARGKGFMMAFLHEIGFSVNTLVDDRQGETMLFSAAGAGNVKVVTVLLKAHANVELRDTFGDTPLSIAARRGQDYVVKILATEGKADTEVRNKISHTPIILASINGHQKCVSNLLEAGAIIDARDSEEKTAFIHACEHGRSQVVEHLIEAGADVVAVDKYRMNGLMRAASNGMADVIRLLIQRKVDIHARTHYNRTCAFLAAENDQAYSLRLLCEHDAKLLEVSDTENHATPLWVAARMGHALSVRVLLELHADTRVKSKDGLSPLEAAIQYGSNHYEDYSQVVQMLLDAKTFFGDVSAYNFLITTTAKTGNVPTMRVLLQSARVPKGWDLNKALDSREQDTYETPLLIACRHQHLDMMRFLLEFKADLYARDKSGRTVLHTASHEGRIDICRAILDFDNNEYEGKLLEMLDNSGDTALMSACVNSQLASVNMLIEEKADVNVQNQFGYSAVMIASSRRNKHILRSLCEAKADVNLHESGGRSGLHMACEADNNKAVEVLLEFKADVNAKNSENVTPLMLATYAPTTACMEVLIAAKADVNITNTFGGTALHRAKHVSAARVLVEAKADISVHNKYGKSPLDLYKQQQLGDLVTYMKEKKFEERMSEDPYVKHLMLDEQNTALVLARRGMLEGIHKRIKGLNKVGGVQNFFNQQKHRLPSSLADQIRARRIAPSAIGSGKDLRGGEAKTRDVDHELKSSVVWACKRNDILLLKFLLAQRADVDALNRFNLTPLFVAAREGKLDIFKVLLAHKASVFARDVQEQTPLMVAARRGHQEIVKLLIASRSQLNVRNKKFLSTALMEAATGGHLEVVEMLLKQGADANLRDANDMTALDIAKKKGAENIVAVLQEKTAARQVTELHSRDFVLTEGAIEM